MARDENVNRLNRVRDNAKMLTQYYAELYHAMTVGDVAMTRRYARFLERAASTIAEDGVAIAEFFADDATTRS